MTLRPTHPHCGTIAWAPNVLSASRPCVLVVGLFLLVGCALPESGLPASLRQASTSGIAQLKPGSKVIYRAPSQAGDSNPAHGNAPRLISAGELTGEVSLRNCLGVALANNLSVRMAEMDSVSAAAGVRVAKAAFDPSLDLLGGTVSNGGDNEGNAVLRKRFATGTEIRAEAGTLFFDNSDRTEGLATSGTDYALRLRQSLLRGASREANLAPLIKARLVGANADANTRIQIYEMLRAAETAYWTSSYAASLESAQQEGLNRIRAVLEIVKQRKNEGAGTKLDVLEAEAAVARAEDAVAGTAKRRQDSLEQLWFVMGFPPQVPGAVSLRPLSEAHAEPATVDARSRFAKASAEAPEVILLANDVRGQELNSTVARNRLLPKVDAELNWGSSSFVSSSDSSAPESDQWSALLRISIPWTFREERAQLDIARAELARSNIARMNGMRLLEKSINETCREIRAAHQELEATSRGAKANRTKFEEQQLRYHTGLASVRDLMEAETELREAETRELQSRLHLVLASVLLARQDGSILDRHQLEL